MANIEMNYYNGSTYETLYPTSISNLIQLSESLGGNNLDNKLNLFQNSINGLQNNISSLEQLVGNVGNIIYGSFISTGDTTRIEAINPCFAVFGLIENGEFKLIIGMKNCQAVYMWFPDEMTSGGVITVYNKTSFHISWNSTYLYITGTGSTRETFYYMIIGT